MIYQNHKFWWPAGKLVHWATHCIGNRSIQRGTFKKGSNHHPSQKRTVMKTMIHRASKICEPQALRQELRHVDGDLQANSYTAGNEESNAPQENHRCSIKTLRQYWHCLFTILGNSHRSNRENPEDLQYQGHLQADQ